MFDQARSQVDFRQDFKNRLKLANLDNYSQTSLSELPHNTSLSQRSKQKANLQEKLLQVM